MITFFKKKKTKKAVAKAIKKLLFATLAVFIAGAMVEGVSMLIDHFLEKNEDSPIVFQKLPDDPFYFDKENHILKPAIRPNGPVVLEKPKPAEQFRVLVFGGSAAMGLGFPYNGSISSWLGGMLRAAFPDQLTESVNLAMVGYSSQQVKKLALSALELAEPDLIVIYSGNNEYLDTKASMSLKKTPAKAMQNQRSGLERSFAFVRLLSRLDPENNEVVVKNPEVLSNYQQISLSEEQLDFTLERYERNLTAVVDAARTKNVPVVLCTLISSPVDNLQLKLAGKWIKDDPISLRWFRQATGWARLGRWDKATVAMQPIESWGPALGLLRLEQAGGIRGLGKLDKPSRGLLNQVAASLVEQLESKDSIDGQELYRLAAAYYILEKKKELGALLTSLPDRFDQLKFPQRIKNRFLFSQFMDEKSYRDAFLELWENSEGGTIANPATNSVIRKVAHQTGAILADFEKSVPDWIEPSLRRFLMDYCHLNIEGNFEVARIVFEAAKSNGALPGSPKNIDFRKTLLEPDLKYLKRTAHDFIDPGKWMGMYFRVCQVYCEPVSSNEIFGKWFAQDLADHQDEELVQTFLQNAALNEIALEE